MISTSRTRLLALLLLALGACKDQQRNAYMAPPPPPVTVATPEVRTVTDHIELTGTTPVSYTHLTLPTNSRV